MRKWSILQFFSLSVYNKCMPKRKTSTKKKSKSSKKSVSSAQATVAPKEVMSAQKLSLTFIVWFIGHAVVLYLANTFFPEAVVLGTHQFSVYQSLFYSMLVFTLITVGMIPLIEYAAILQKRALSVMDWIVLYFIINTAGIWVVARFAEMLGLGISSWLVAVALGLVLDLVQGLLVSKAL